MACEISALSPSRTRAASASAIVDGVDSSNDDTTTTTTTPASSTTQGRYIAQCTLSGIKSWENFRFEELRSAAYMETGIAEDRFYVEPDRDLVAGNPMAFIRIADDATAQRLLDRTIMTRAIHECWGHGTTLDECLADIERYPLDRRQPWLDEQYKWCIRYDRVRGFKHAEQTDAWETAVTRVVQPRGEENPPMAQVIFRLIAVYDEQREVLDEWQKKKMAKIDDGGSSSGAGDATSTAIVASSVVQYDRSEGIAVEPKHFYFVREVARNRSRLSSRYTLKKRCYIGPTSTDADLAFLMCNLGHVRRGSMVLDPFVGTGSILIAAAHNKAFPVGYDLDWRMVHGRMKKKTHTLFDNFKQYGLPPPEILCADVSIPLWREQPRSLTSPALAHQHQQELLKQTSVDVKEQKKASGVVIPRPMFDAIVTDPPYGIRAGPKKSGTEKQFAMTYEQFLKRQCREAGVEVGSDAALSLPVPQRVPPVVNYDVAHMMNDLLDIAAQLLHVGGRLVYLLPTPSIFAASDLPQHPTLRFVSMIEQVMRGGFSRMCVTMVKAKEWDGIASAHCEHYVRYGNDVIPTYARMNDTNFVHEQRSIALQDGDKHKNYRFRLKEKKRKQKEKQRPASGVVDAAETGVTDVGKK